MHATGYADDTVSWYERNASSGALTYSGMLKDGLNGVDGLDGAHGITLSPDGKHAYVSGDLDDSITWHERNATTGALTFGECSKTESMEPMDWTERERNPSTDGKHAYVTGIS